MLHEGNEVQGKCGKQGLSIARRCIAIAMDQGGSTKIAYMDTQSIRAAHGAGSTQSIRAAHGAGSTQSIRAAHGAGSGAAGVPAVRRPGGRAPTVGAFRRRSGPTYRSCLPRAARFILSSFRYKL